VLDLPISADQEAAAHNPLKRPAHEFLRAPCAVGFQHFVRGVAEQRKIQFLLGLEALQQLHRIGAGTQDDRAALVELRFCVTKLGRLNRSTRSVGLRKEENQDTLPVEVAEGDFFAVIRMQGEVRSFVADFEHRTSPQLG